MKSRILTKGNDWEIAIEEGQCGICHKETLVVSFNYSWHLCYEVCEECLLKAFSIAKTQSSLPAKGIPTRKEKELVESAKTSLNGEVIT